MKEILKKFLHCNLQGCTISILLFFAALSGNVMADTVTRQTAQDYPDSPTLQAQGDPVFEIWNWDDLSKINNFLASPTYTADGDDAHTLSYYTGGFKLMQDLGIPKVTGSYGTMATPDAAHTGNAKYGWYGYQGFTGDESAYTGATADDTGWDATTGWIPIGNAATPATPFTGTFDGNNHTISGLWIDVEDGSYLGLFATAEGATFQDLNIVLDDAGITGNNNISGLVGTIGTYSNPDPIPLTTIHNVSVTGTITAIGYGDGQEVAYEAPHDIGGFIGLADSAGVIIDGGSKANVAINVFGNYYRNIGGMIGSWKWEDSANGISEATGLGIFNSTADFSFETESITVEGGGQTFWTGVGGLIGYVGRVIEPIEISGVDVTATVHTPDMNGVGGLIGHIEGSTIDITDAETDVDITGNGNLGGFIGMEGPYYDGTSSNYSTSVSITNGVTRGSVTGKAVPPPSNYAPVGSIGGMVGTVTNWFYDDHAYSGFDIPGLLIDDSHSDVKVTGTGTADFLETHGYLPFDIVGGLVGSFSGYNSGMYGYEYEPGTPRPLEFSIKNSYATGDVSGDSNVGGLVGNLGGYDDFDDNYYTVQHPVVLLKNSYATGNVSGNSSVGGLVGYAVADGLNGGTGADIINCFATGTVTGTDYIGGLIGYGQPSNLTGCFAMGNVTGAWLDQENYYPLNGGSSFIGGFAGSLGYRIDQNILDNATIPVGVFTDNYARGNVEITALSSNSVGGFAGELNLEAVDIDDIFLDATSLERSYYSGTVIPSGSDSDLGAFIGTLTAGTLGKLYYDIDNNPIEDILPIGTSESDLDTAGKSTDYMTGTEETSTGNIITDLSVDTEANSNFVARPADKYGRYYPQLAAFENPAVAVPPAPAFPADMQADVQKWSIRSVIESKISNEWQITGTADGDYAIYDLVNQHFILSTGDFDDVVDIINDPIAWAAIKNAAENFTDALRLVFGDDGTAAISAAVMSLNLPAGKTLDIEGWLQATGNAIEFTGTNAATINFNTVNGANVAAGGYTQPVTEGNGGLIRGTDSNGIVITNPNLDVYIKGGTITAYSNVITNYATLHIADGTIENSVIGIVNSGILYVDGGIISSTEFGVVNQSGGTINISGNPDISASNESEIATASPIVATGLLDLLSTIRIIGTWEDATDAGTVYVIDGSTYGGLGKFSYYSGNVNEFDGTFAALVAGSGATANDLVVPAATAAAQVFRALWTGTIDSDWQNPGNWTCIDESGATLSGAIPDSGTDVWIPGNGVTNYPILESDVSNDCDDIYFMPGAAIGQQQYLTYTKAHVQLDFGLEGSTQDVSTINLAGVNGIAADGAADFTSTHLSFSAGKSGSTLTRNRWYMLSPALQNMISGDFAFGDYPRVFMRKFNNVTPSEGTTQVGQWNTTFATQNKVLSPMDGFAIWVNGTPNNYALESGTGNAIAAAGGLADNTYYGLQYQNGIIELPFYENAEMSAARRIHRLNESNESEFYYVWTNGADKDKIDITTGGNGAPDVYERNVNSYRLIDDGSHTITGAALDEDVEILIGNPYMSSIDFVAFLEDNEDVIEPYYRLWNGTDFFVAAVDEDDVPGGVAGTIITTGDDPSVGYIAPMQSFFVTLKTSRPNNTITFDVTRNVVSPAPITLRSSTAEENIIRIQAQNNEFTAETLIAKRAHATDSYRPSEDVYKLFSQKLNVPEIYTIADKYALVMNFVKGESELTIPLGLKTNLLGATKLTLSGMTHYAADKIELIDVVANQTIDITHSDSYEYAFNNLTQGVKEGQFYLRILHSTTGINTPSEGNNLYVSRNQEAINVVSTSTDKIKQISIYDLLGRTLYENDAVNSDLYAVQDRWTNEKFLLVKVITEQGVQSVKLSK
jgi:hypothetical protein